MKLVIMIILFLLSDGLSQTKVGELAITAGMKSVQFNLFPDSNLTYSSIQGDEFGYFDTIARKVNLYSIPSLTLNKSVNAPAAVDNKDYLTITKKWFNEDEQIEFMYYGYYSGTSISYHCAVYNETGSLLFSANGMCALLYQKNAAYISVTNANTHSIFKLRDISVAISSISREQKEIFITRLENELIIDVPNSSKSQMSFMLLELNGKQISSSKLVRENRYAISFDSFRGVAVLASKESNGTILNRSIIIQ